MFRRRVAAGGVTVVGDPLMPARSRTPSKDRMLEIPTHESRASNGKNLSGQ